MVKRLEYPIVRAQQNMALRKDGQVSVFYRIPNTPITITDTDKKTKQKVMVSQIMKKLAVYKQFEVALVPKDYLLEEKMRDFSKDLAPDTKAIGEQTLNRTTKLLTKEMEIPYEYEWLMAISIQQSQVTTTFF